MTAKGWTFAIAPIGLSFLLALLGSCGDSDTPRQRILTPSEMVKALTEIYLYEQKVNKLGLPRDSAEVAFEQFKPMIFEKIGVPDSVFKSSFDYYMDRPVEMEKIYSALVDSLSLMEQRLDSPPKK
jgi:hypothetical protein